MKKRRKTKKKRKKTKKRRKKVTHQKISNH
jgi:hypothetical protein